MKRVRLVPSNRVLPLLPKHPITGEPLAEMDEKAFGIPKQIEQSFTFQGQHRFVITAIGSPMFENGNEITPVWVDLVE